MLPLDLVACASARQGCEDTGVNTQTTAFKDDVSAELEEACVSFHRLLDAMSPDDLRRPTNGTKWNNEELLFHMLFGYLIMWALILIVRIFSRLPMRASMLFAMLLNGLTVPFNIVNYLGSRIGAKVYKSERMGAKFDKVAASLRRKLAAESDRSLYREMYFPAKWDPFFKDRMSLADVYHYPTQHFEFHRWQLSTGPVAG